MSCTEGSLQTTTRLSPQTSIQVLNPANNSQKCHVDAIVDTGAVMTCIPESTIIQLGNSLIYDFIKVQDFNGHQHEIKIFWIDIKIGDYSYQNLKVLAISQKYALIGRDILNQHKVVLNAPEEMWGLGCNERICPIMAQNG